MRMRTMWLVFACVALVSVVSPVLAADRTSTNTVVIFRFEFVGDPDAGGVTSAAQKDVDVLIQHADDLYTLIGDGLTANKFLSVMRFEPGLATVQRAVREQRLTEKDASARLDTTPSGLAKAQKMGSLTGSQLAVIGSIDKYIYRQDKGEIEMTATVQIINLMTGKVVSMFTATGRAAGSPDKPADETAIGSAAVYDVAEKLIADIAKLDPNEEIPPEELPVYTTEQQPHKGSNKGLIITMLGAVLIGFLVGNR
jgi:hypothetical protein